MNKIYLLTVMEFLLLTSLSVHAFGVRSNQPVSIETQGECDSIYLSNGKEYAVKNLVLKGKEVSFQFCEDIKNQTQTMPWQQLKYIKKADGTILTTPHPFTSAPKHSNKRSRYHIEEQILGIVLLFFAVQGMMLLWLLLFFIYFNAYSYLIFILAAVLGYILLVLLFKTAFTKLMPHKRKRTRNILAAFSPLLIPVVFILLLSIASLSH